VRTVSPFSIVLALLASAGCAQLNPATGDDGLLPGFAQKPGDGGTPINAKPETYAQLSQEQRDRPVVAPALGYEAPEQPGVFTRMRNAVAGSTVVKSMTSVFRSDDEGPAPAEATAAAPPEDKATSVFADAPQPDAKLHVQFARAHEKSGNFPAAAEQYEKALALAPADVQILLSYARLRDRQGQFDAAVPLYERAVKADPASASAVNDLGLCYARQGHHDKAVAALNRAIKLQPDRKLYRNNLATVYVEMGRIDDAYHQLAAAHPPAVAHYNLGYLLTQANNAPAARQQFAAALASDPKLTAAQQWLDRLPATPAGHAVAAIAPPEGAPRPAGMPVGAAQPSAPASARPTTVTRRPAVAATPVVRSSRPASIPPAEAPMPQGSGNRYAGRPVEAAAPEAMLVEEPLSPAFAIEPPLPKPRPAMRPPRAVAATPPPSAPDTSEPATAMATDEPFDPPSVAILPSLEPFGADEAHPAPAADDREEASPAPRSASSSVVRPSGKPAPEAAVEEPAMEEPVEAEPAGALAPTPANLDTFHWREPAGGQPSYRAPSRY
jgi:tetratricopeptide (TPR) repeat protein